ncbi:MAG: MFS transporter [Mesorhizobium sp.]
MTVRIDTTEPPMPWAALGGVTASVAVFGIAQGLSYPYFTFLMQSHGLSAAEIGLSAAMTPAGLIVSALFLPQLVRRLGASTVAVAGALVVALLFLSIGLMQNWIAWYPVRFLIGLFVNPLYILGEVWAMALAPPSKRGRVMGFFNAVTGAGYATGPLSLALVGSGGWPPLIIGISGFLICALLLAFTTRGIRGLDDEPSGQKSSGVLGFWFLAPALLVAVIVSSANQTSIYSLMPVFGAAHGLAEARLATLLTAMSVGNIILQFPLGLMAERVGARTMILVCAVIFMSLVLTLPFMITSYAVLPLLVIIGGLGYGVYTMSQIELGNRFSGQQLVAGNSAFGLMWGVGGMLGPPGAGALIQSIGANGLIVSIVSLSLLLVAFMTYRTLTRGRSK